MNTNQTNREAWRKFLGIKDPSATLESGRVGDSIGRTAGRQVVAEEVEILILTQYPRAMARAALKRVMVLAMRVNKSNKVMNLTAQKICTTAKQVKK